ncbi:MAG TPA: hypothetical protein VGU25_03440 [Acidobacteriaceae bacterium]|nr:hypothetical protein [Acidobacteriaceae bacterium]
MTGTSSRSFLKALVLCLLVAGTLDISDALIFYGLRGVSPERLLQNIASALIGPQAFHGGLATALLGLAIHYAITLCWAALFLLAAARFAVLTRHAVIAGLVYGGIIYVVMNFLVLPLTRLPPRTHLPPPVILLNAVLALLLFQGLPIALIARRCLHE